MSVMNNALSPFDPFAGLHLPFFDPETGGTASVTGAEDLCRCCRTARWAFGELELPRLFGIAALNG